MRLWKRFSGALKDNNSLLKARLFHHSTLQNPEIDKAIIKATSHDEYHIDFYHTQCVFSWILVSDENLWPILSTISNRIEKTHDWVVALKGLMLMHGVFCCNVSVVLMIERLPVDLSNFKYGRSESAKRWSFDAFIRSYYAFLEQKWMVILQFSKEPEDSETEKHLLVQDLVCLQKLQILLDTLLQIKPQYAARSNMFVLEAMNCLVIEIFDVYSRICDGIICVLVNIQSGGIEEARTTLSVLEKVIVQGENVSEYLEFCRQMGVINASKCLKVEQLYETDIQDLANLIREELAS